MHVNHGSDWGMETHVCSPASAENTNCYGKPAKGQSSEIFCLFGFWEVII